MKIRPLKFTDKEGITYFISAGGSVYIELNTKKRPYRKIGKYDFYNKAFIKEEKVDHNAIYHKLQAFGFPYHLLKELHANKNYGLNKVIVEFKNFETYTISTEKLFEKGFFLNYKKQGLELRIFVKISEFERKYIHPKLKKNNEKMLKRIERKRRARTR